MNLKFISNSILTFLIISSISYGQSTYFEISKNLEIFNNVFKELNTYYFSDNDHKIEHTVKEFYEEMNSSGLIIKDLKTIWGEIWAVCIVK